MPPLKSFKHELLARNIIKEKGDLTEAYMETYPKSSHMAAKNHVHRMVANGIGVRERVLEIMEEQGLTLPVLTKRLHEHIHDDEDKSIALKALQTGLKMQGTLDTPTHVDNSQHLTITTNPEQVAAMPDDAKLNHIKDLLAG